MSTDHKAFGDLIHAARKAKGKTLLSASLSIGVSDTNLWGLEKGRNNPSFALAIRIARYYGLSVEDMARAYETNA